jgi:hypothetical protein
MSTNALTVAAIARRPDCELRNGFRSPDGDRWRGRSICTCLRRIVNFGRKRA